MSGLEVAGVILGAIPILVEGLSVYKSGLKTIGSGFRKRRAVEKLSRALLLQRGTLEELSKQAVLLSGCDLPAERCFETDALKLLNDINVRNGVEDFLGKNFEAFTYIMDECNMVFQQLVLRIAAFVPSIKDSMDLARIIDANRNTKRAQFDLMSRMRLALSIKDIEEECRKLDESVDSVARFLQLILSNRQLTVDQPSRKAKRLAKKLWTIRKHAVNLHTAVSRSWVSDCHEQHEARLLLENCLEECQQPQQVQRNTDRPDHIFRLVFSGDIMRQNCLWHESAVHIFDTPSDGTGNDLCTPPIIAHRQTPKGRVTIHTPPPTPRANKVQEIRDICSAIENAGGEQEHILFALTTNCKVAKAFSPRIDAEPKELKQIVHLKDLFARSTNNTRWGSSLSWKSKITLALTVASNFLQLLRTPWSAPKLSAEKISFLQDRSSEVDVNRPFLSQSFVPSLTSHDLSGTSFLLYEAVLELGIMLLEIWYEKTLRESFALAYEPSLRQRQALALEWYDEASVALPDHYLKAVFFCIAGVKNVDSGRLEWDNMKLWETVCECVIEPLSKISKI